MYVASPTLRGDAGSTSEVLPGLPLALLSEETLADQLRCVGWELLGRQLSRIRALTLKVGAAADALC